MAEQSGTAKEHFDKGDLSFDRKDWDTAIQEYTEAIMLDPNYVFAYCNRGGAYNNKGDHDHAIKDYTEVIRLDPNNANIYCRRGCSYDNKGEHGLAIKDLTEAIRLDPNFVFAYRKRGFVYESMHIEAKGSEYGDKQSNYNRAIADYTEAIRLENNPEDYFYRGRTYSMQCDSNLAIADFNEVIRLDPNHVKAYDRRGLVYEERGKKGDYDLAIADFTEVVRLAPNYLTAYFNRGTAYCKKRDYNHAIADFNAAIRIGKFSTEVPKGHPFLPVGNYVTEKSQIVNAQETLKTLKATSSNPSDVQAYESLIKNATKRRFAGRKTSPILGGISGLLLLFGLEKLSEKITGLALLSGKVIGIIWLLSAVLYIFGSRPMIYLTNKRFLHKLKKYSTIDTINDSGDLQKINFLFGYIFLPILAIINTISNYIIPDKMIRLYEKSAKKGGYWKLKDTLIVVYWVFVSLFALFIIIFSLMR